IGVPLGNGTIQYPNGDTVQVIEPWSPPSTWGDTTTEGLNAILNDIERGLTDEDGKPTGQRYTNMPKSPERAVWPVVQKHYPNKPEGACREIIHAWLASGLIYPDDYDDPLQRRKRKGLFVRDAKRPGASSP